jgi:hypothetical protein
MALLVITINDPGVDKKSAEAADAKRAVDEAIKEFGRGNGIITSGTILSRSASGVSNTSLGSSTYTSSPSKP